MTTEEQFIVGTVRDFVDREVRPVTRDLEDDNT
ncbi:acyl-CoA dehydrogenase family protein [Prauserella endophytica]|uniref:Acyl-CoA dehydrogenase family protein n=1 Tax=Prauserella endophytica TaxID=1592324 RepID=A0ABY2S5C3_9PSEU|nr:acyl-CoA dehydrogenase family protein [Prauserella endophytica]TKG70588.1 acyl-CoA dehydrogenase family protein [Prauserella endophytica]